MLAQKLIVNGQFFVLSEAFGLNSGRTDDTDSRECVICLTEPKGTILHPCKHVVMCGPCA